MSSGCGTRAHTAVHRNDILRSKGIIPEKPPSPTPMIQEAIEQARQLAYENRLEGKDVDELAELEDEEDEDFLESYRYVCAVETGTTVHVESRIALTSSVGRSA
jgi:hypothetical protein